MAILAAVVTPKLIDYNDSESKHAGTCTASRNNVSGKDFGWLVPLIAGGRVATAALIALRHSDMSRSS